MGNVLPSSGKESTAPRTNNPLRASTSSHCPEREQRAREHPSPSALPVNQISVCLTISKLTEPELCQLQCQLPVCSLPAPVPWDLHAPIPSAAFLPKPQTCGCSIYLPGNSGTWTHLCSLGTREGHITHELKLSNGSSSTMETLSISAAAALPPLSSEVRGHGCKVGHSRVQELGQPGGIF